jgi:methylenetetrahydrofolate dehydrogenase (NADP+)/methenyltetrahydrofolate cyclohydrolase
MMLAIMKKLDGSELAAFIKERQAKKVRSLKQAHKIEPKLAIIRTISDPIIDTYIRLKRSYGEDIGVDVVEHAVDQSECVSLIAKLNKDDSVHGIIVQLPIEESSGLDQILNSVSSAKDVDGLAADSNYEPATPLAIEWLLDGYNIELNNKRVVIVGQGRLVGAPLTELLSKRGSQTIGLDQSTKDLASETKEADIIVSATGHAGLIKSDMLEPGIVGIDAGVATEGAKTVGDFDDDVYKRDDIITTPQKGGVGPLTVCALFENLLRAASSKLV